MNDQKGTADSDENAPLSEAAKERVLSTVRQLIESGDLQIPPENIHYPKPDRTGHVASIRAARSDGTVEIGWYEGHLSDGRPFRVECWAEDQITSLTYFMSTFRLAGADDQILSALLEQEGLLRFTSDRKFVDARKIIDDSGHEMWSINVVVGDEDRTFVEDLLPLSSYGVGNLLKSRED